MLTSPTDARTSAALPVGQGVLGRARRTVGMRLHRQPWIAHLAIVVTVLLLGCVTALFAAWTVEGIIALGMFPVGATELWSIPAAWLLGAVVGAALLLARRTRPLAVVGTLTLVSIVSLATAGVLGVLGVCLAFALYSVASTRTALVTWTTVAVVLTVVITATWWWQDIGVGEIVLWGSLGPTFADYTPVLRLDAPEFSSGRRSATAALLVVLLLLGVAMGTGARARRLDRQALVERYDAVARDRDAAAALARASERARIAREMHDIVAHSVSVMIALSDGAGAALERAPERSREALQELSRTGRSALADMQRVLGAIDPDDEGGVRPEPTEPTGTDLQTIVDRFRTAGLPITASGLDVRLPADTSLRLALVRIVSEALTNVLRHAVGAHAVAVTVRRSATGVEVEVLDDGGSSAGGLGGGSGRGLPGMRERAALLGGHAEAGPRPEGGWRVHVLLPCDEESAR